MDAAISALALNQHGVITLAQLRELGLSASAVHKRASASRLHRIYRGVYALTPIELLDRYGRWMAAVSACGPGAVLSHRTAAALHELRRSASVKVDVTVPRRASLKHKGIHVHRSTTLTDADVTVVNGIACTTVARTLFDLATCVQTRPLERAFDEAAILEVLDLRKLDEQFARNPNHRGTPMIRAILRKHRIGQTPTWSELEETFLRFTRAAGFPDPECNTWIDPHDGGPMIRVDFLWRAQRLVVEADGYGTHRARQKFERDRLNDQRLTVAGYKPMRTTWLQLNFDPKPLERAIASLL